LQHAHVCNMLTFATSVPLRGWSAARIHAPCAGVHVAGSARHESSRARTTCATTRYATTRCHPEIPGSVRCVTACSCLSRFVSVSPVRVCLDSCLSRLFVSVSIRACLACSCLSRFVSVSPVRVCLDSCLSRQAMTCATFWRSPLSF
jgi:hypothetical protein